MRGNSGLEVIQTEFFFFGRPRIRCKSCYVLWLWVRCVAVFRTVRVELSGSAARVSVINVCRGQLKCDGTRAETRFRLSAKRTSPFKSAGTSVQSATGSRGVGISGSNAGYTMF